MSCAVGAVAISGSLRIHADNHPSLGFVHKTVPRNFCPVKRICRIIIFINKSSKSGIIDRIAVGAGAKYCYSFSVRIICCDAFSPHTIAVLVIIDFIRGIDDLFRYLSHFYAYIVYIKQVFRIVSGIFSGFPRRKPWIFSQCNGI